MYSGQKSIEGKIYFEPPVAKRQMMFSEDECLEYGYCGFDPDLLTSKEREKLKPIYVSRIDEYVSQITDCYPVVRYFSENTNMLNRFVESITVAIISGKRSGFDDEFEAASEIIDNETIVYLTDQFNVSTEIYFDPLCRLLYQKPKLTVTKEGVLIFYTPTTLFATLDCKSGSIVDVKELAEAVGNEKITDIFSVSINVAGSTIITFKEKNKKSAKYNLSMIFDFFDEGGVTVKID